MNTDAEGARPAGRLHDPVDVSNLCPSVFICGSFLFYRRIRSNQAYPPLHSIRRQLTMQILAGTLVLLLLAGTVFFGAIHRRLVGDFDRMLETEATALAENTERKKRTLICDMIAAFAEGAIGRGDAGFCELFLEDGTVVTRSPTLGMDHLPRLAGTRGHAVRAWNERLPDGRNGRHLQKIFRPKADDAEAQATAEDPHEQTFPLPDGVDPAGVRLVLVVARSRERLDALITSLFFSGAAVAVAVACVLAWFVSRAIARGLQPLEEIKTQIAVIAPAALEARVRVPAPPLELAPIVATLNRLLDRVEQAFVRERRFSSDLAHELRTPIAELRNACEVGARWPEDAESTRQFFDDTRAIALQMETTVATLLTLARCESGTAPVETRRIHLQELVRQSWRQAGERATGNGLKLDDRIPPELTVECDEDKLGLILRNLVDNAVAHSARETVVECSSVVTDGRVELLLVNSAQDLERADLEHIFDRFWRKDSSRSDRRHAGLGLSIARALCDLLGLRLGVALREGRLFEARLTFPAAAR